MKQILSILTLLFLLSCSNNDSATSSSSETAKEELEQLLGDFLRGASVNNAEMHDRFWAEDLIYTSSSGERISKQDIMSGFGPGTPENSEPTPEYGYEDLQIMVFDDAAVVAFRLVGRVGEGDEEDVMNYYNTGTFLNRNSEWQAVAWQATRIPE